MGIGIALAIGIGIVAAGCAGSLNNAPDTIPTTIDIADELEEVAEETTADEPPSVADGPELSIEAMHITDASAALTIITMVPDPSQPMILAFGEFHDLCLSRNDILCVNVQTTASHFSEEIFPLLHQPQYGAFQDHVNEFFRRDPVVHRQLQAFMQGADFDSSAHIGDFMSGRDFCPLLSMLETARSAEVTVHGSHLSLVDLAVPTQLWERYHRREVVWDILGNNIYEEVEAVYNQGRSVSAYAGATHFDPDQSGPAATYTSGPRLLALAGDYYRAVVLVVPEIAERDPRNPILTRLDNWQQYIPDNELTLLRTTINGNRSLYYIIYPRTSASEIRQVTLDEIYSCTSYPSGN